VNGVVTAGTTSVFRIERDTTVAAQKIYDRLADAAAWNQWAPVFNRSDVVQLGPIDPLGAGAIRRLRGLRGLLTIDEQILEATRPSYQRYTALRGLPAREYSAEVRIDELNGGTRLVWTGQFKPRVPGTGWVLAQILAYSIGVVVNRLIAGCERAAVNGL